MLPDINKIMSNPASLTGDEAGFYANVIKSQHRYFILNWSQDSSIIPLRAVKIRNEFRASYQKFRDLQERP